MVAHDSPVDVIGDDQGERAWRRERRRTPCAEPK
jgi:hypothetical protein